MGAPTCWVCKLISTTASCNNWSTRRLDDWSSSPTPRSRTRVDRSESFSSRFGSARCLSRATPDAFVGAWSTSAEGGPRSRSAAAPGRPPERHEPGLLRMEQPEVFEALTAALPRTSEGPPSSSREGLEYRCELLNLPSRIACGPSCARTAGTSSRLWRPVPRSEGTCPSWLAAQKGPLQVAPSRPGF